MRTLTLEVAFPGDLHARRAQENPDGTCWVHGDRTWTWDEAWHDIRRFAGSLRAAGIGRGDRFAFIDRSNPSIVVAMQAAGLIGAADVVLNPYLVPEEVAYILEDSGARLLFVGHEFLPVVDAVRAELAGVTVVVVGGHDDELEDWIAAGEPLDRESDVTPSDPCLVLYSSGTTGRSKGIVLTQHNLMVHTRNAFRDVEHHPGDMILIGTIMFHSCALFAAAAGTAGVFVPDLTPVSLVTALRAGMTHAFVHPTALTALQLEGPETMAMFAGLRYVSYGTAPMPSPVLRRSLEAWPDATFRQVYGMTETVAVLTVLDGPVHRDRDHPERLISSGRPTPGVEMRVVDPSSGTDVEPGLLGELWFRTEQTTPGYLNDPAATAELITPDGWVRTGDLGRVDGDGFVYVEDRKRDLIIVDGYNVFSAEVDRVLTEHPHVLESAVIGVPDDRWGEAVKALVVLREGSPLRPDELIAYSREHLAAHKAPTSVEVVAELPHSATGKVLKRVLRAPYWAAHERQI